MITMLFLRGGSMDVEHFLDQPQFGFFVDGEFHAPANREVLPFNSPVTKATWRHIVQANTADVSWAIESAQKAFVKWKNVPAPKRGEFLRKVGDLLMEHKDKLAWLMAMEMGKPIAQGI